MHVPAQPNVQQKTPDLGLTIKCSICVCVLFHDDDCDSRYDDDCDDSRYDE